MSSDRRRAWECAHVLMDEYRDRLHPRAYGLCRLALQMAPDAISMKRAKRLQAIFASFAEVRR